MMAFRIGAPSPTPRAAAARMSPAATLQALKNPNTSFDAWLYHVTTLRRNEGWVPLASLDLSW